MDATTETRTHREPWNKGKLVAQKAPFKIKDIWALRLRLKREGRVCELALLNLGIDSKLRGCDLVAPKVRDVCHGDQVALLFEFSSPSRRPTTRLASTTARAATAIAASRALATRPPDLEPASAAHLTGCAPASGPAGRAARRPAGSAPAR